VLKSPQSRRYREVPMLLNCTKRLDGGDFSTALIGCRNKWIQPFCASFAQVSFNVMVRLKIGFPGALSLSNAKYASRSN
jgi:hypothetical protein